MNLEEAKKINEEFLQVFPIEKLRKLKIEEYTNTEKTSFCYWLESKTEELGSIWGGSSYKFGIYKMVNPPKPSNKAKNDGVYAWYSKYGNTAEKAYKNILTNIVSVVEAVQKKEYEKIDNIDLEPSYKWKIAYLYSDMSLINIYAETALRYLCKVRNLENPKKATISQLQQFLISKANNEDLFSYSRNLWNEWINSEEYKKENDKEIENDEEVVAEKTDETIRFKKSEAKTFLLSDKLNDDYTVRYINSLLAKPFTILTGNSGTGKTRIALQVAHYLGVQTFEYGYDSNCLYENQKINEWTIQKITKETIYLTNEKEPQRMRPIQKDLLQEFVDFYRANPAFLTKKGNEDRELIRDLPTAGFDKFLYGFDATLRDLARYILGVNNTNQLINDFKNCLLVPVGADWTDNTKILGYFNPLANNGKGEFIKSEILEFIELANDNPKIPFFLILDEMNLSHVERYFSDFLSAMESGKPILLYKKPEGCECNVDETITLPKNLFVTGTVNIDETTYMFSPKVLDRANVIEFAPPKEDVLAIFNNGVKDEEIEPAPEGVAEAFVDLAEKVRNAENKLNEDDLNKLSTIFGELYDILKPAGFEFAYRTTKEILLYCCAAYSIDSNSQIDNLIDEQIVQKILPKIHGNKKQIEDLLKKLYVKFQEKNKYPLSNEKVESMLNKLDKFQYASFI